MDAYSEAHLFVAAIRVLHYQKASPPNVEEVCSLLGFSDETGHGLCRKLHGLGIVEIFADPFSVKMAVANHLELEKLPRTEEAKDALAKELERFQAEKKNIDQKVAALQAEMARKKQDLFADIEAKFKKEMEKQKKG